MPTYEQVAAGYVRRLLAASDEQSELQAIASDMKALAYPDGGRLTMADKTRLVNLMDSCLRGSDDDGEESEHGFTKVGGRDNAHYLQLVSMLRGLVR